jgi:hypothetical protein
MANPATGYTNEGSNRAAVTVTLIGVSPDAANNRSTVTWSVNVVDGSTSARGYNFNDPNGTGGFANGGLGIASGGVGTLSLTTTYATDFQNYDFGPLNEVPSPYFPRNSGTLTGRITHTSSGTAGPVFASGSFTATHAGVPMSGPVGNTGTINTDAIAVASFVGPSQPVRPTLTRTGTGETIGVTAQVPAANTLVITKHQYRWSYDESTWNGPSSSGTSSYDMTGTSASFTADPANIVYVQTRAISTTSYAWGTGAWSLSRVAYAAPSITATSSAGVTAYVTVAPPASNGGSVISSHTVEYSTSSTFATGVSTNTIAGSAGGTATINNLLPGLTWYFRARYVNAVPVTSPYSNTTSQFIAAYGRRYQTVAVQGVSAIGSTTTYNSTAHGFSLNDPVSVTGLSSTYNASGTVTAVTTNSFTLGSTTPATTSGSVPYTATGAADGWASILSGKRYDANGTSPGVPGWVAVGTAQRYDATGIWKAFN